MDCATEKSLGWKHKEAFGAVFVICFRFLYFFLNIAIQTAVDKGMAFSVFECTNQFIAIVIIKMVITSI